MYEALQILFADEIDQRISSAVANTDVNTRQEERQSGLRALKKSCFV